MVDHTQKAFKELVRRVGRYREEAFHFVREGLSHAADHVHGPETEAHQFLQRFLITEQLDWGDLIERYQSDELPEPIMSAIQAAGGIERLDRHVSGRELCWGLRDFALRRWGMLARTVLASWNVVETADFGRIVFGFIECDMMQKQPGDNESDFEQVYDFSEAFDKAYQPMLGQADDDEDDEDDEDQAPEFDELSPEEE